MKKIFLIVALLFSFLSFGQLTKTQAVVFKGLTTVQISAYTPGTGETPIVYDSDLSKFQQWNGAAWVDLEASLGGLLATDFLRSNAADIKDVGDLTFNDNVKIALGTSGAESEIYSDGTDTNINLKSGDLIFDNNGVEIASLERTTGGLTANQLYSTDNGQSAVFGDSSFATKYIQIREGSFFAARWGLQANNNIDTDGACVIQSSKAIAFRVSNESFESIPFPHFYISKNANVSIGGANDTYKLDVGGTGRFTGDVIVPAEAYGAGWNGSDEVPTKNDVYDKIESIDVGVQTTKVSLTASQIKTLNSSPVTLISAQGAGTVIEVLSAFAKLTWGSVAFDNLTNTILKFPSSPSGNEYFYNTSGFLTSTSNNITSFTNVAKSDNIQENEAIQIESTSSDSVATGDSTLDIYITYRVVTL